MVDYTGGYENPPPVTNVAEHGFQNNLATEEFEGETKKQMNEPPRDRMTIRQALMASRVEKSDGKISLTANSLFEVGMYTVFLAVLVYVAFARHSVQTYYYTKVLNDLFVNQKGASDLAFTDVAAIDDIWTYFNEVLISGLYWDDNQTAMVYFENRLLGEPRIRMLKVTNTSCVVVQSFSREIKECYSSYDESKEDRTKFGPGNTDAFNYATAKQLETNSLVGTISTYGGGGFVQHLPMDDNLEAQSLISSLKAERWIDRGTRAVIIDFSLYNANVNLFCVIKLLFETPATGGVIPTAKLSAMDLIRYQGTFGKFMIAFEGIFTGFVAFFVLEELFEVIRSRLRYFIAFWNLVDIAMLSLSVAAIVLSIRKTTISTDRVNQVLKNNLTNAPFDDVVDAENMYNNIVAILLFIAWVKVFKYISVNKTMSQLSATLTRSAKDIGGFAVMFAVFFFAYAQFGYLLFGTQIADYSTFYDAVFALLRTILGDFDFNALERTNRVLGPAFFISYVFFVFFVLLNMFLAIINDSYVEVKAELARKKDGVGILDWVMTKLRRLAKRGKKPDAPDRDVTYEDYKAELVRTGYDEKDINEAFIKYAIEDHAAVTDKMMENLSVEMTAIVERKKNYSQNHRDYIIMNRRVDQIESSIVTVIDQIDAVIDKLSSIEKDKVRVKDQENRLQIENMFANELRQRQLRS